MALIKTKKIKGVDLSYWKITDCNVKTGEVSITPFYDKDAAQDRNNIGEGVVHYNIDFPNDVANPLAYAYGKIKESKMEMPVPSKIGDNTKELVPVETNYLADAEDEV